MFKRTLSILALTVSATLATSAQAADYKVTITNITPGQTFTPQLVVTHQPSAGLFTLGEPASDALAILAESGNPEPLIDELANETREAQVIDGLLGPGESTSVTISGKRKRDRLSVAAMLIPTNDTFVALNSMPLPSGHGQAESYMVSAYDAGTEYNDQSCQHIPGPRCGGEALSEASDMDEGFVHVGNGFHHLGDEDAEGYEILGPMSYDWRNAVAHIVVERMR